MFGCDGDTFIMEGIQQDDGTHVGFPLVSDQQEDVIQLIQLFLRVPRGAADRDHHYVLQHCDHKSPANEIHALILQR